MKEIKDYLHLYLGQTVTYNVNEKRLKHIRDEQMITPDFLMSYKRFFNIKILLRPLSDITEEEKQEFIKIMGTAHLTNIGQWAVGVKYLLSKSFDLFELIESNLALDKTKMEK